MHNRYFLGRIDFFKSGHTVIHSSVELNLEEYKWQSKDKKVCFQIITPGITTPTLSEQDKINNVKFTLHFVSRDPLEVHWFLNGAKSLRNFNVPWIRE